MEFEKALKCLEDIPFFADFTKEEKRFLASMDCNLVHYRNGEIILKEGDVEDHFYILLHGSTYVTRSNFNPDGTRRSPEKSAIIKLTKLTAGSLFGELSFIKKRIRATSIVAEGNVSVFKMGGTMIEQLNPLLLNKIKNQIIDLLLQRLDGMNDQLMKVVR